MTYNTPCHKMLCKWALQLIKGQWQEIAKCHRLCSLQMRHKSDDFQTMRSTEWWLICWLWNCGGLQGTPRFQCITHIHWNTNVVCSRFVLGRAFWKFSPLNVFHLWMDASMVAESEYWGMTTWLLVEGPSNKWQHPLSLNQLHRKPAML